MTRRDRAGTAAARKRPRTAAAPFSLRVPPPLRDRIRGYARARHLEEATAARVLMAERLNEVDEAQELARADAWQLAQVQEAWRDLRSGRLKIARPDGLARIFREAEERAGDRAS